MHRVQQKVKRQVLISTHSADLLSDEGIGGEEVLVLSPAPEGTEVQVASTIQEVRDLLENGFTVAEAIIPRTKPKGYNEQGLLFDV